MTVVRCPARLGNPTASAFAVYTVAAVRVSALYNQSMTDKDRRSLYEAIPLGVDAALTGFVPDALGSCGAAEGVEAAEGQGLLEGVTAAVGAIGIEGQQAWPEESYVQRDLADVGDDLAALQLRDLAIHGLGEAFTSARPAIHARDVPRHRLAREARSKFSRIHCGVFSAPRSKLRC